MSELQAWWAVRSLREKRLLLVMLALLAVAIVWLGVLRPLDQALSDARRRQANAVVLLGDTDARVAAVRALGVGGPVALAGPLDAVIRQRADEAGFTLATVTALSDDRLRVTIAQARPAALLPWLAQLEQAGVLVEVMAATANGDRTVAVDLTLRTRRS